MRECVGVYDKERERERERESERAVFEGASSHLSVIVSHVLDEPIQSWRELEICSNWLELKY